MKSPLRRLIAQAVAGAKPPVQLVSTANGRGLMFDLGTGSHSGDSQLRTYQRSGTVFSIVSLLAQSTAGVNWHLYKKTTDGRVRYSSGGDHGSDQRTEVLTHAAIQLWNTPNVYHSGFEFRENAAQHLELAGMTVWVLDLETATFPTAMWTVRPDRIEAVPSATDYLAGWIYKAPDGTQVPLKLNEVIVERLPDPLDPFRGASPISAIMPNIQQQDYATQYQRNLFLNGANPGGILMSPNELNEREFDELADRWREAHQGVARAGRVAVLEKGIAWQPSSINNRDLEYGNLRLQNRDEIREAFRMHKAMLGTSDDVNRANAETADEVFAAWLLKPRLERRKMTLNTKLLPLFGTTGQGVEFDYDDPTPENSENAALELHEKAQAAQLLVNAGYDPHDVLEVCGLPDMEVLEKATQTPALPPAWVPASPAPSAPSPASASPDGQPAARETVRIYARDTLAKVYEQQTDDYPVSAISWMHHAAWSGPVSIPLSHINPTMAHMDEPDPAHVQEFVQRLQDGKKVKPVVLVKLPGKKKLKLIDGHHRYLAAAELGQPVKAFVGTVDADTGPWDDMHEQQSQGRGGGGDAKALSEALLALRPYTARALPAAALNRRH